jgi:DNA-binding transcriptional LysR family regulator
MDLWDAASMELTLDHWRVFVVVVDEGSFSAAARRLRRVQSAVSHAIRTLEQLTDCVLFDRSEHVPVLTAAGQALLSQARRFVQDADALAARARRGVDGVEPRLSVCIDAVFPIEGVVAMARAFSKAFPDVELTLRTESLSAVTALVQNDVADLGVCLPPADVTGLEVEHLGEVRMVPVAHTRHPLAQHRGPLSARQLDEHVQIVLSERTSTDVDVSSTSTPDQGVVSGRTWRVLDLETKQALIAAGLGWGNLPLHRVRKVRAQLVVLDVAAWGPQRFRLDLACVQRRGVACGPAARFVKQALAAHCRPVPSSRRAH